MPGNAPIYDKGDASETAYLILSGEVALDRIGVTIVVRTGALIGFSGLFNRPYGSTATTRSETTLLAFSRRELRALIRSNPDEALRIVEAMVDLLGQVAEALENKAASADAADVPPLLAEDVR